MLAVAVRVGEVGGGIQTPVAVGRAGEAYGWGGKGGRGPDAAGLAPCHNEGETSWEVRAVVMFCELRAARGCPCLLAFLWPGGDCSWALMAALLGVLAPERGWEVFFESCTPGNALHAPLAAVS